MKNTALSLTALTDLAVVSLTGKDATSFLQSQLTQDINALDHSQAALAGYCTAKGRLLASMVVVQKNTKQDDGWLLLTKADAAMAFAQRLRMFVLRADVDVTISETAVIGVRVSDAELTSAEAGVVTVSANGTNHTLSIPGTAAPYSVVRHDDQIWIRAPERAHVPHQRWWLLNAQKLEPAASDADLFIWQADDIAAGLPWVQAATQEAFIPQTMNMDLIEGVSFTKGCYPGQEVVARSHYRGTIKRRMAYATGNVTEMDEAQNIVGTDTFNAHKPGRPCGRIINAALTDKQLHVLMEVQLTDLDSADFRVGADDGPAVTIAPLPYDIQSAEQA